jgi:hypothetical protein
MLLARFTSSPEAISREIEELRGDEIEAIDVKEARATGQAG